MKAVIKIFRLLILILAVLILLNIDGTGGTRLQVDPKARISHLTGKSFILPAAGLEYQEAEIDMPVGEGDRIGTAAGRMEIDLGNGNYIRLNHHTRIDVTRLPRSSSRFTQLRLWAGGAIVSVESLENEKDLEINTPDVTAYFLDKGVYRLDIEEEKETRIHVFRGLLEAAGEADSILLRKSQQASAVQGRLAQAGMPTAVIQDNFYHWNRNREEQVRKHPSREEKPDMSSGNKNENRNLRMPLPISPEKSHRGFLESPLSRLYEYVSQTKIQVRLEKKTSRVIPESSALPPKKIRPPNKKKK